MKTIILLIYIAALVSFAACGKWTSEKKAAHTGKNIPEFSLKDPRGKAFTRKDILENGAVFVVPLLF
jgi:hypothetical protein